MNNLRIIFIFLLYSFTLQSVMAQGNGAFDEYQKKKAQEQEEWRKKKQKEREGYLEDKRKEFEEYRRKKNEEFARYLERGVWEKYKRGDSIEYPKERDVNPIVYDKSKDDRLERKQLEVKVVPDRQPLPQPNPIIEQNQKSRTYNSFNYYGTELRVRWGDLPAFKLKGTDKTSLANGYRQLTSDKYNNLLSDCLKLRKEHALCDWAYYKMLEALSVTIFGKKNNEAVFLQGVLFQQSGYTMRFAMEPQKDSLCLLASISGIAYDKRPFVIDGKTFYAFDYKGNEPIEVCKMSYKDEQDMSMALNSLPNLAFKPAEMRTRSSESFKIKVDTKVNHNLLSFMKEYPTSYDGHDMMTRWAYYANAAASEEMKQSVYPQLRNRIAGVDQLTAVNMLLNWVQTGFDYELDEKLWGHDRAFFAEETLAYPFSDCEDRAILFSRLVRDLVGLDVVLVYYEGNPSHLSTAVCFKSHVDGYYHNLNGRQFVVADPCYINAGVGRMMPDYVGTEAKVILLRR